MKIKEQFLKVEKTARYYSNLPENKISNLYFVIHGYAQLASEFISEFEFLQDGSSMIIAPEGLSRFYSRNRIGASWMTREDRVNEINDYISYLDKLFEELKNKHDLSGSKNCLLGFSQGVHTAVRWFISGKPHFDKLILCSSDFPSDADFKQLNNRLETSELFLISGSRDDVLSRSTFTESAGLLGKNNTPFKEIIFDGKHEINKYSILEALKEKTILNEGQNGL